jgi:hypothetical protein
LGHSCEEGSYAFNEAPCLTLCFRENDEASERGSCGEGEGLRLFDGEGDVGIGDGASKLAVGGGGSVCTAREQASR